MKRAVLLLFFLFTAVPAFATTYYVSASGSGSTCSSGTPCTVATALAKPPVAGDRIEMQDGTYTGANGMITPASGLKGSVGNVITIEAINDGAVTIDGQDARVPLNFTNDNDYFLIQGMDFANSSEAVVEIQSGSDHNTFKRICAWDAIATANYSVWSNANSDNNVFEDVCGFGTGRKIFGLSFETSGPTTLRRAWGQWEYHTFDPGFEMPKETLSLYYNSKNVTVENVIMTQNPRMGTLTGDAYGMATGDQFTEFDPDRRAYINTYGSIFYLPTGINYYADYGIRMYRVDEVHYYNDVVYIPADHSGTKKAFFGNCRTADSGGGATDCSTASLTATNLSLIGGTAADVESLWVMTNVDSASTVAGVYTGTNTMYVNDGTTGATVCKRYVDGVLTATPLWPWPMNDRIIAAMTTAGETTVDVDATIQGLFGAFPASCTNEDNIPPACAFSQCETFDAYTLAADLDGGNDGTGWTSPWTKVVGAFTIVAAPAGGQGGNAMKSTTTAGYYRNFTSTAATTLRFMFRNLVAGGGAPNGVHRMRLETADGTEVANLVQDVSGNCSGYNGTTMLYVTILACPQSQWHTLDVEIDVAGHPDQYRARVNLSTWSDWIDASNSFSTVSRVAILDEATNSHQFWVDAIGGSPAVTTSGGKSIFRSSIITTGR